MPADGRSSRASAWPARPAGKFDKQIVDLLATAPNNAELTMWHEAAALPGCGPGNEYDAYAPPNGTKGNWMTAANLRAGHEHLQNLCARHKNSAGGNVTFKNFLDGIAKDYKFHITETNSHVIQHRKNWALFLSEWMSSNGGYRFEWFYHAGGKLSGPYSALEPSTRTYIAEKIIPVYGKRT